jgi:hypothetical protein
MHPYPKRHKDSQLQKKSLKNKSFEELDALLESKKLLPEPIENL